LPNCLANRLATNQLHCVVIAICCHTDLPTLSHCSTYSVIWLVHVHQLAYMITSLSPFPNTHLERLFHLEHINLKGWPHNWHRYHVVEWYVHSSLSFGTNLMPFQHFNCLDFMFLLDMISLSPIVLTTSNCIKGP
jgi:hypothetical protein